MTSSIEELTARLDTLPAPLKLFFRDDDIGPADERLYRLLDLFGVYETPLDLAVIPEALEKGIARMLRARHDDCPRLLGLHQHGWQHVNHETTGRKCEFGASRSLTAQQRDIMLGQARLREAFGEALDPIFTPPWNRCTAATVDALIESDIAALSRNTGAAPLAPRGLRMLDIAVDWCRAPRPDLAELNRELAACAAEGRALGVMLHHEVMHEESFDVLEQVLDTLVRHPLIERIAMRGLLHEEVTNDR